MLSHFVCIGSNKRIQIDYKIKSVPVCKAFFREATGIRRQTFDAVVDELMFPQAKKLKLSYHQRQRYQDAIGFLDAFFLAPGQAGGNMLSCV
jgi:hypothetical protein